MMKKVMTFLSLGAVFILITAVLTYVYVSIHNSNEAKRQLECAKNIAEGYKSGIMIGACSDNHIYLFDFLKK